MITGLSISISNKKAFLFHEKYKFNIVKGKVKVKEDRIGQPLARVNAFKSVRYLLNFIYADIFQEYGKNFNSRETAHAHTT